MDRGLIRTRVEVKNLTTGTDFRPQPATLLCEIELDRMTLEAPTQCCAMNHHLLVFVRVNDLPFATTARVESIETDPESGTDKLVIRLIQYETGEWSQIHAFYAKRQSLISRFLNAARGLSVEG